MSRVEGPLSLLSPPLPEEGLALPSCTAENPYRPLPPALPLPRKPRSELRLLECLSEEMPAVVDTQLKAMTVRLDAKKEGIKEVSAELMATLKKAAEQAQTSQWWSLLKKIADCFLAALSLILGFSLVSSGGGALAGGALIAAGILSFANLFLSECKGWDWISVQLANGDEELREKLNVLLPIIAALIACVLSFTAGFSGGVKLGGKVLAIAQGTLALFATATQLGKGISDAKLTWNQSEIHSLEGKRTVQEEERDLLAETIHMVLEHVASTMKQAQRIMRTCSQTYSETSR